MWPREQLDRDKAPTRSQKARINGAPGDRVRGGAKVGQPPTVGGDKSAHAIGEISVTADVVGVGITAGIDVDAAKEFAGMFANKTADLMNKVTGSNQAMKDLNNKDSGQTDQPSDG